MSKSFKKRKTKKHHLINEDIKYSTLRVVDKEGKLIGIFTRKEALKIAEKEELDLVLISTNGDIPVAKLIDYGSFLYKQQKREKEQQKKQSKQRLKEIRFNWRTDTHDYNFKLRHAKEFIEKGNKVKSSIMFKGREIAHKEIGVKLMERFIEDMSNIAKIDQPLKSEGRLILVILSPKGKKE